MKFRIKDEDGKDYEVEEILEQKSEDDASEAETIEITNNELSDEEIKVLKELVAKAPEILNLLNVEKKEHEENPELLDEDEEYSDEEKEECSDENEEVEELIETQTHDSKSSFGSLVSRKTSVDDSLEDEVSEAWAKRYGGIR